MCSKCPQVGDRIGERNALVVAVGHPKESFVIVLCSLGTEYVSWMYNFEKDECSAGTYSDSIATAADYFEKRCSRFLKHAF